MNLVMQGLFQWLYSLAYELWDFIVEEFIDVVNMDFTAIEESIKIIPQLRSAMLIIGWALLIGNLVFQAVKSMMYGIGVEGEDPRLLFTRTFLFAFLLLASPQICDLALEMTSSMVKLMNISGTVGIQLADEATVSIFPAPWLTLLIVNLIVMFQSVKLIFEMAERYFILIVLTISAPVAFGMGGSRNTSDIFSGWCRMYGSMCLLMVLNVMFIKMLFSVLSDIPMGLEVVPWVILVLTIVKVAKKIDAIVTRIGLNPAITGESLGRTFPGMLTYMVGKMAFQQITSTVGANASGGKTPSPSGGGSKGSDGFSGSGGSTFSRWANDRRNKGRAGKAGDSVVNNAQSSQSTATVNSTSNPSTEATAFTAQSVSNNTGAILHGAPQKADNQAGIKTDGGDSAGLKGALTSQNSTRISAVSSGAKRSPTNIRNTNNASNKTASQSRNNVAQSGKAEINNNSAKVQNGTAEKSAPIGNTRFTRAELTKPGTAGTSAPSTNIRSTNVSGHSVKEGAVNSAVQNKDQSSVSVSNGKEGQSSHTSEKETRFTQRPNTPPKMTAKAGTGKTEVSHIGTAGTEKPTAVSQPQNKAPTPEIGTAGIGAASSTRQTTREPQHSRNEVGSGTVTTQNISAERQTARQEQVHQPSAKSAIPPMPNGTAGKELSSTRKASEHISHGANPARQEVQRISQVPPVAKGISHQIPNGTAGTQQIKPPHQQSAPSPVKPPEPRKSSSNSKTPARKKNGRMKDGK